jgi:hypothetical protein
MVVDGVTVTVDENLPLGQIDDEDSQEQQFFPNLPENRNFEPDSPGSIVELSESEEDELIFDGEDENLSKKDDDVICIETIPLTLLSQKLKRILKAEIMGEQLGII